MRRISLHLSLILAIALTAIAQQEQQKPLAPSAERLREHVTYLASDKLEGRRTGSEGAIAAAEYIAREFARAGLRRSIGRDLPGMSILEADSPHRFMQEFPFVAGVELGKSNAMLFTPKAATAGTMPESSAASLDLRLNEDWLPLGFSSNARVENAPATFVGYGLTATDLNYDDYVGADVTGRVALALEGTPESENPHSQFVRLADVRWKSVAAKTHGANALVVIAREEKFQDDKLSRLAYDNSAGDAGLPVAVISRQAAARILEAGGLAPLAEIEKALAALRSSSTSAPAGANENRKSASAPLQNVTLTISTDIVRRKAPAYNVAGILDGRDPLLKNEYVIIGAHYDHLGRGGQGSLASREGEIHHGADDNASGVAALLELARIFAHERMSLRRSIVFIAFGGEEEGLIGSNFYVNNPIVPLAQTVAMINMDMIGRMKNDRKLIVGGIGTAAEWKPLVEKENRTIHAWIDAKKVKVMPKPASNGNVVQSNQTAMKGTPMTRFALTINEDGFGPSDHSSFYAKQVPVLFLWTGTHEDYHKPSDTAEKINYEGEAQIVSFVADIVRGLERSEKRPTYAVAKSESIGRTTSFRVYLGTVPVYADSNDGMKLDAVRDDSPAAEAGLKAGDVIVKLAGRDVRNVYDYTAALSEMKAGQEYEVEIMRGGQRMKLKIMPTARK